jgi:hypothetical protein
VALGSKLDVSVLAAMVEDRGKILTSRNPGISKGINVVQVGPILRRHN